MFVENGIQIQIYFGANVKIHTQVFFHNTHFPWFLKVPSIDGVDPAPTS